MKKWLIGLALVSIANVATASVEITFDDLTGSGSLPADYQGFTWTGWTYYDTVQTPFTPESGATRIFADETNSITASTAFVFDGSYLSGFAGQDTVQYFLYKNDTLVFSSSIFTNLSDTPTYFASGYAGAVDKVVFKSDNGFYSVDNFTYSAVIPVPEPENLSLMLAGLGLAGWMRRRSQK
jgi:hypothetical protein